MCKQLERNIQPDDDDDSIQDSLGNVWVNVNKALKEDPILKARLADQNEFQENIKNEGEGKFIELLKDMAKKKNWRDLLENGPSFLPPDLKRSNRGLSPDVFLKQLDLGWNMTPASMNGAK
jgi:hypothetical protein